MNAVKDRMVEIDPSLKKKGTIYSANLKNSPTVLIP